MSTYTIGETARRSGFSASALRFYEDIGLVGPAGRTDAGYRLYDDGALERLAFVARAKQLGCSLEEITDLLAIWDGRHCAPVQRRFHDLVTTKIAAALADASELRSFTQQLRSAADRLGGEPEDGSCGPGCACLSGATAAPAPDTAPVAPGRSPDTPAVPIACTLEPGARADRRIQWAALLADAARRDVIDGGLRVQLGAGVDVAELGRLIAAEQHCCAFFHFTLVVGPGATVLEVRAPDDAAEVVDELFGRAA